MYSHLNVDYRRSNEKPLSTGKSWGGILYFGIGRDDSFSDYDLGLLPISTDNMRRTRLTPAPRLLQWCLDLPTCVCGLKSRLRFYATVCYRHWYHPNPLRTHGTLTAILRG